MAVAAKAMTPPPGGDVAGKIVQKQTDADALIQAWLGYLERNGRSAQTLKTWRSMIVRDCRELGITSSSHLDYQTVVGGLERLREEHGWGAATFRCHLSAFKSLHKHLQRTTAGDIQAAEGPTDNEPGEGSRAATLDEARRLIAVAWDLEQNDRRSRSSRTLYWLCMFAAGCREEDHWHWRWDNVRLDAEIPHVRWAKGIQKNKRTMHVALAPELVGALREHRAAMQALAVTMPTVERTIRHQLTGRVARLSLPVHPDAPGAPVFICKPQRDVFRKDAQRAEIAYRDERERIFSPHSARKFFKTQMVLSGVPAELAEHLMRHSPKVAGRYVDP
ncbi:MAG: site-specific integrase, partial [Phycisphaerales bacterium]|nr:site-specific integrase [Phycisphaerales bacterium]